MGLDPRTGHEEVGGVDQDGAVMGEGAREAGTPGDLARPHRDDLWDNVKNELTEVMLIFARNSINTCDLYCTPTLLPPRMRKFPLGKRTPAAP